MSLVTKYCDSVVEIVIVSVDFVVKPSDCVVLTEVVVGVSVLEAVVVSSTITVIVSETTSPVEVVVFAVVVDFSV